MSKGSSGSRRWIQRKPIDARPITSMYDEQLPAWWRLLEAAAPWGCFACLFLTLSIVAYMFGADYLAGHWRP